MSHLSVITRKPVAIDSPDHLEPHGTAHDNSVNLSFNVKLGHWLSMHRLRVLDLGCAGGGFVKSILDDGGFAVGIEGSDYSKIRRRAEWATIPDNLFTADITEPFQIMELERDNRWYPAVFNVITAWEVLEHIPADRLTDVAGNIKRHLTRRGVVIMSISPNQDVVRGVSLHQTVAPRDWWIRKFWDLGFRQHDDMLSYFGRNWVRSEPNAPRSFHLVMTRTRDRLPHPLRRAIAWWRIRLALRTRLRRALTQRASASGTSDVS
jgi:hypothetical protein